MGHARWNEVAVFASPSGPAAAAVPVEAAATTSRAARDRLSGVCGERERQSRRWQVCAETVRVLEQRAMQTCGRNAAFGVFEQCVLLRPERGPSTHAFFTP